MARIELRRDAGRVGPTTGPWIRNRQIAQIQGLADPRELVELIDRRKDTLGWGLISPESTITVRMIAWGNQRPADDWLELRLAKAFTARQAYGFGQEGTTGYREVNSEGDGLPGLVVDRYGDDLVVQITTAPMAARRQQITNWIAAQKLGAVHVVLPEHAAAQEGFEPGLHRDHDRPELTFKEHGLVFQVPAPPSQKTGAYFDQRVNRRVIAELAQRHGGPLLDVGCHVGGFALHAQRLGIASLGFDQSKTALEMAARNAEANDLASARWVRGDMFSKLDQYPELGTSAAFGTIVLDPPKIASRKSDTERALAALNRLIAQAGARLQDGGHLVVCSCSHHIGPDQLDKVMATASGWTRVMALGAGPDHPVAPGHREGEYLRVNVYQRR